MKFLAFFLSLLMLTGCASQSVQPPPPSSTAAESAPVTQAPGDTIGDLIGLMTLEQRVGQLFLARCDAATAVQHVQDYHLGGFVLFGVDFENQTPDSIRETISAYQAASQLPLLIAVDEEGGTVNRVSRYRAFRDTPFPSPRRLYDRGGLEAVLLCEQEKAALLTSLGINVNLAPVCDITTDPAAFMYHRSLGQNPQITSEFIRDTVKQMGSGGLGSCLKHFPGYGNNVDTHTGIARDSRPLSQLEEVDLCPFRSGIAAGCDAILVSHTIVECLDPEYPASLSPALHQYLRDQLGFSGVIVTDDLVMQAITDLYGAGEAAVLAVLAGNDLLCSTDYPTQYAAVLDAVYTGRIDMETLDRAVRNVLEWKLELGLLVG